MLDNKRTQAGLHLRAFFDEQIQHLHQLIDELGEHFQHHMSLSTEDNQIIESFVDAANSKMRIVDGYAEKLRERVRALHDHVSMITDQLPIPVALSSETFHTNPLINALFAADSDIERLLKTDQNLKAFCRSHSLTSAIYGMLIFDKHEKHFLGVSSFGDLIVRDMPQQVVNFSSHKINVLYAENDEFQMGVRQFICERIIALLKNDLESKKTMRDLFNIDNSYEARVNSLSNPDVYLNALIDQLTEPQALLNIQITHFKLSKQGVKLSDSDFQLANEFDIYELIWSDMSCDAVLPIKVRSF